LNNRFNVRADIGYDVNDHLAVYGLAGYSAIGYEVYNFNAGSFSQKKNSFEMAPLFGAGFKTAISKNVDLTFEYTTQRANLHTSTSLEKTKTKLNTYGIGLAYNF
jgi:opacity protein-like surface antigen